MPLFLEYRHKRGIFPNTQLHQAPEEGGESDIVWGAAAIAKEIGRTERQAFHRCSRGICRSPRLEGTGSGPVVVCADM